MGQCIKPAAVLRLMAGKNPFRYRIARGHPVIYPSCKLHFTQLIKGHHRHTVCDLPCTSILRIQPQRHFLAGCHQMLSVKECRVKTPHTWGGHQMQRIVLTFSAVTCRIMRHRFCQFFIDDQHFAGFSAKGQMI